LAYKKNMTMLDVMIAVGGLTDFADGNAASITRASEGEKRYSVRLKDLVKGGDISANVEVKPGDILIIPQGWF
jgi:polysaccharide export outer membrane protein